MTLPIRFHWRSVGDAANPAILFLHGFMGSCDDWRPIAESLVDHYYSVAVDLPGHGGTTVDGPDTLFRIETCAEGLVSWMRQKSIHHPHCVGYSMGGRLALYLAAKHGSHFRTFTIESGTPGLASDTERAERRRQDERLAARLEEESLEQFIGEWYEQPLFASLRTDPQRYVTLVHRRLRNDPHNLAVSLRQMGTGVQPSLWGDLNSISNPTLLIVGASDDKFNAIAEQMVQRNERFQISAMAGAGHNIHVERPGQYVTVLREFMSQ